MGFYLLRLGNPEISQRRDVYICRIKNTYFTDNVTIDCQPLEFLRCSVEADVEDSRKLWAQGGCPDVVGDGQDARKHWHST